MSLLAPAPPLARSTLALFDDAPRQVRLHVWTRWRTCPLAAVADRVGPRGRVLDIGCGHGLLAAYLALGSPAREVVGVDLDDRKLAAVPALAERVRARGGHVALAVAPGGAVPDGPWDTITIVDVLYLLPRDAQRTLVEAAAARLAPGGRLVVKEMASQPAWKARWNIAQELLAVKVLRITASESSQFCFVDPLVTGRWLEGCGLVVEQIPVHRGYVHPHHLLVAMRHA